jgi:type VI secretion system protein ImpH
MAGETGQTTFDLKQELLTKGHEFTFIQAMRLLGLLGASPEIPSDPSDHRARIPIRIRSDNSLAFPAADITAIEENSEEPGFRITANFLGLYGPSSPLPTFYTEEVIDEANSDESVRRDFLDIYNHLIYALFYTCCKKYNLFNLLDDEQSNDIIERIFCAIGIADPKVRKELEVAFQLCRYIGLIIQRPHSAWGLETMLRDALGGIPVRVRQCHKRMVKIRQDQHMRLGGMGCSLGNDTVIGQEVEDRMGKFRLEIGSVDLDIFDTLLPGNPGYKKLSTMTRFYVVTPFESDVELILAQNQCRTVCLGSPQMSRLGLDTWVFSGDTIGEVSAAFPLS